MKSVIKNIPEEQTIVCIRKQGCEVTKFLSRLNQLYCTTFVSGPTESIKKKKIPQLHPNFFFCSDNPILQPCP